MVVHIVLHTHSIHRVATKFNCFSTFYCCCFGAEQKGVKPSRDLKKCPRVYLDVKVGDDEAKRIEIALYNDVVPKTAENFRALCTGEKGETENKEKLHYKNSIVHRLIAGFMLQVRDHLF